MERTSIRMKLLDILQEHMTILPIPEGVRINFVFRTLTEFPTLEEICSAAGVSREAAESVLEKYVHYGVVKIHHDPESESERYEYTGITDDIKRLWRANPVRGKSLESALQAGEDFLNNLEGPLDQEGAEEVQVSKRALSQMREEFLGKGD